MSERDKYESLRKLFLEARKLSPADQKRYITQHCSEDPALAQELSDLLQHDSPEPLIAHEQEAENTVLPQKPKYRFQEKNKSFVWGVILLACLGIIGFFSFQQLSKKTHGMIEEGIQTICEADVAALSMWIEGEKKMALQLSQHPEIHESILVSIAQKGEDQSKQEQLRSELLPIMKQEQIVSVVVTDATGLIVFSLPEDFQGAQISSGAMQLLGILRSDSVVFSPPHYDRTAKEERISDIFGPLTWIDVAVRDEKGQLIGTFNIAHRESDYFSPLLGIAQFGHSGETFAFDRDGILLSESRFQDELMKMGVVDTSLAIATHLRITQKDSDDLTEIVKLATAAGFENKGAQGNILDPYINYTGEKVVGSWQWIEDYGFGVASEVNYKEATSGLRSLAIGFWLMYGLLVIALLGWAFSGRKIVHLEKRIAEQEKFGPYEVERQIGEGGLGKVYLAKHALLKRPTALKVLRQDNLPPDAIGRFEKEVVAASNLRHPNTIEIFDYGRTSNGTFYYAMEYLNGLDLKDWVKSMGPFPVARTVHVLLEASKSLQEAHDVGLIHRDIKPGNIYLCEQGGVYDQVKVLDFGLVKDLDNKNQDQTRILEISGSPHFMAPERIRDPFHADHRVDIYSLGGLAYFMLSGLRPLDLDSNKSMIDKILEENIPLVSEVAKQDIPIALVQLIAKCLDKDPRNRPANVHDFMGELKSLQKSFYWSEDDAAFLWENSKHLL